jgi:hypothetical protein
MPRDFEATITLNDHHLDTAGLSDRKCKAVAAVREAIARMEGAGWIDVEAESFPPGAPRRPAWWTRRTEGKVEGRGRVRGPQRCRRMETAAATSSYRGRSVGWRNLSWPSSPPSSELLTQAVARAQRYLAFLKGAKDVTTPEAILE